MTMKHSLAPLVCAVCLAAFSTGAMASTGPLTGLEGLAAPILLAKHGADDPAGDNRRGRGTDDGAGHASIIILDAGAVFAKNGADDPVGGNRRGRGADDGVGHA